MVSMAVPIKACDHEAITAGHEPRLATRARATPAGALAWVAYVRVVISFCAFTRVIPEGRALLGARIWDHAAPG